MKKNIIIVTFNKAHNYGAMLQEYALLKKTSEIGDSKILNYDDFNIAKNYKYIGLGYGNFLRRVKIIIKYIIFLNINIKRYNAFNNFEKKFIKLTENSCTSLENIANCISNVDILITGSDQVWNPQITNGLSDIYTLNFGKDNIKRISYAASLGSNKIAKEMQEEYKDKISKLDYISVREESGANALKKIIKDKKISVVLDPTLLLSRNDWEKIASEGIKEKNKYIIAYIVEKNPEQVKIVDKISELTGLKVIHFEKIGHYKNILKSAYIYGPESFVSLIKNAEYVVTTSFHATVFSIIFNKKFWVVPHKTTGSRVTDLLAKLGISNRAVNTLEEFNKKVYNEEIDYDNVNKILEKEREKSIKWLKDAIEK